MTSGKAPGTVSPYAWVILALIFFASMAGPLNMAKVPPLMSPLMKHYEVGLTGAGWLMSVFAIVGAFLALPSGFFMGRMGAKTTGLVALGVLAAGSFLGATTDSFVILMLSRVLEGAGMCFMSILAPAAISAWFPPEKRGLPMGIWAIWVPAGTIIVFILAPRVAALFHWQHVWWLCAFYSVLIFALYLLFFRMPEGPATGAPDTREELRKMRQTMKRGDPWLLALAFGAYNVMGVSLSTYMPRYLEAERGFSPETASLLVSGMLAVTFVSVIWGGVLSDKLGTRKKCIVFAFLSCVVIMGVFYLPGYGVVATMWGMGFAGGLSITPIFTAATEIVPPDEAPFSLAVLTLGQNVGMFLGPLFFAVMVESAGWVIAMYACMPFVLLAAGAVWRMKMR